MSEETNELRKYLSEAKDEWIDLAERPAPISGKRLKKLSVWSALSRSEAKWMFEWAVKGLTGIHVRDEDGNWIDVIPAAVGQEAQAATEDKPAVPEVVGFDSLPVHVIRFIFAELNTHVFLSPLPV